MQFAKTGLVLQHSDRPLKRRDSKNDSSEIFSDPDNTEDDFAQPMNRDVEVVNVRHSVLRSSPELQCSKEADACSKKSEEADVICAVDPVSAKKLENEHSDTAIIEDPKPSLATSSCSKVMTKSTVCFIKCLNNLGLISV